MDMKLGTLLSGSRLTYKLFPYFGGKSKVADVVWSRFGVVPNYIEPFFGSGAILFANPRIPSREVVSDADMFLANFWRAVKQDPDGVVDAVDAPLNEADLHARHYWLITDGAKTLEGIIGDPNAFNSKIAGWWLYGACGSLGGGWCSGKGPWAWNGSAWEQRKGEGDRITKSVPKLGGGNGINRTVQIRDGLPGDVRRTYISNLVKHVSVRLRNVTVTCGSWERVCTPVVVGTDPVAIFMDPPYSIEMRSSVYRQETNCAEAAVIWAKEHGEEKNVRIAFCGYEGEHTFPDTWETYEWKAIGGYGNHGEARGRENAEKERVWFSPHCIKPLKRKTLW